MFESGRDQFRQKWQFAWQSQAFRVKFIGAVVLVIAILSTFPFFFQFIEKRDGIVLNDRLLGWLPAYNVSASIFILIWAITLITFYRLLQEPEMLMQFLWAYAMLSIMRILTISMVPLNPPHELQPLADPVSNIFYGQSYVTKDLFFSGHTATVFLLFLYIRKPIERSFVFAGCLLTALLLLVQHVHYSLDVFMAPLFAYLAYHLAQRMFKVEILCNKRND